MTVKTILENRVTHQPRMPWNLTGFFECLSVVQLYAILNFQLGIISRIDKS